MVKPGKMFFRSVKSYNPITQIVTLNCGHTQTGVWADRVTPNVLFRCGHCEIPERTTRVRNRKPFWLTARPVA